MSLPRAVLEAEKRADEILQQLNQAPRESQPEVEVVANDQQTESEPPKSEAPAEPATESKTVEAPPAEEDPTWEQRYKSLIGKYNAEVPRFAAQNRELTAKLQSIEKELESLRAAKSEPRQSLVKPEEVQEFGEPLVDLIRRAARDEVAGKDQEIEFLKARLERFEASNTKNAEVDFIARLSSAVPDWEEINQNDGFLKWLAEYDELTGRQRQDALDDAQKTGDAIRAARFFNKWKDMSAQVAATTTRSLEAQVVPSTVTVDSAPKGKKIWTREEVNTFYDKVRRGAISDKDMVAIEAEIHAATIEKRIR